MANGLEVGFGAAYAGMADCAELLASMQNYRTPREWVYASCLTDLPVLLRQRPLIADVSPKRQVGLVSLPALGGMQPYRRVWQMESCRW